MDEEKLESEIWFAEIVEGVIGVIFIIIVLVGLVNLIENIALHETTPAYFVRDGVVLPRDYDKL